MPWHTAITGTSNSGMQARSEGLVTSRGYYRSMQDTINPACTVQKKFKSRERTRNREEILFKKTAKEFFHLNEQEAEKKATQMKKSQLRKETSRHKKLNSWAKTETK